MYGIFVLQQLLLNDNGYAEAGEDLQFGRTENLIPFESEQYYFFGILPGVLTLCHRKADFVGQAFSVYVYPQGTLPAAYIGR